MDQNYSIRNASQDDLETVFNFICHLEERTLDYELFEKKFKENIEKPDILYLVAINDGDDAIGFISCHGQSVLHYDEKCFEIQEMYISKSYRGKGIEKSLLGNLEERLSKANCERLEISVETDRADVKKFYLKTGFRNQLIKYIKVI